ncbi:hypothetical protein CSC67_15865 [Pusillimonas caeni]|uniref:hypothetical protein n=1 Tax=Pusillimonas caeni TaxID=1348472 RepID=UPI000E59D8A6|nr:hypothetical protein [Pusillimonas caeni]TFL11454.1 hypothetical protein CSC67_15865 [Pusillimonas caeni]
MFALFKNRLAYLSVSLILLVCATPLISLGTTTGPSQLWWLGLAALFFGGLIPPVQRLLLGPPSPAPEAAETSSNASSDQGANDEPR